MDANSFNWCGDASDYGPHSLWMSLWMRKMADLLCLGEQDKYDVGDVDTLPTLWLV